MIGLELFLLIPYILINGSKILKKLSSVYSSRDNGIKICLFVLFTALKTGWQPYSIHVFWNAGSGLTWCTLSQDSREFHKSEESSFCPKVLGGRVRSQTRQNMRTD